MRGRTLPAISCSAKKAMFLAACMSQFQIFAHHGLVDTSFQKVWMRNLEPPKEVSLAADWAELHWVMATGTNLGSAKFPHVEDQSVGFSQTVAQNRARGVGAYPLD